jgi:PAS domain S-box-containing protein
MVFRTDPEGRLTTDMPRWREVTGQTPEGLLGTGWLEGVHPDDRDRVAAKWAEAVRRQDLFAIDYRITGPQRTRWLEVRAAPVPDERGVVEEWIGRVVDVTPRREAELLHERLQAALDFERRTLEQVVAQASAAVAVLWGPEHEFRLFNERYVDLIPAGRELRKGMTVAEVMPEAVDAAVPLLDQVLAGEVVQRDELAVPFDEERAHRGFRYYDFTYSPLVEAGVPVGVLVVATESTESVRRRQSLERQLTAERGVAEQLQRALLPDRLPELDGLRTAVAYLPAMADVGVGGDWYDAVRVDVGRVLLVIGDVGGRGLEAATVMSQLRSAVRAYAVEVGSPGEILSRVATYCERLDLSDLVTVAIGLLDLEERRLSVASAGHLPPLVVRPGEPAEFIDLPGDPPLGTGRRRFRERVVDLPAGSTLILYTDGLVEERDRSLAVSLEQLRRAVVDGAPHGSPEALRRALLAHATDGRPTSDDVALMVCATDPVRDPTAVRLPARPSSVSTARATAMHRARELGAGPDLVQAVRLAVSEAATNAVLHAAAEHVWVGVQAQDGVLSVTVSDDGHGMRPRADSPGVGLGLPIVTSLAQSFEVSDGPAGGTEVRIGFSLSP